MTLCPVDGGQCQCQPDEGMRCTALQDLRDVLEEAMQQTTEYDGLDITKIGPQHWYTKAEEIIKRTAYLKQGITQKDSFQ